MRLSHSSHLSPNSWCNQPCLCWLIRSVEKILSIESHDYYTIYNNNSTMSYSFFSIYQVHCISCENKNNGVMYFIHFQISTRSQQQQQQQHELVCTFLHSTLIPSNKAPLVEYVVFQVLEQFDDIERIHRFQRLLSRMRSPQHVPLIFPQVVIARIPSDGISIKCRKQNSTTRTVNSLSR